MKIGIDIDNTICDSQYIFWKMVKDIHGIDATPNELYYLNKDPRMTQKCVDDMLDRFHSETCMEALPYPGASRVISKFYERNFSVHFITFRHPSSKTLTESWLESNGFHQFEDICYVKDKSSVCESIGIDYMIDDAPEAIESIRAKKKSKCLIYDQPWNHDMGECDLSTRVINWESIMRYFLQIEG